MLWNVFNETGLPGSENYFANREGKGGLFLRYVNETTKIRKCDCAF